MMDKTKGPKKPKGPKGPKKPSMFSEVEEKLFLKQFSINVKSYKDIKQKDTEDGLMLYGMPVFKAGKHREFDYSTAWLDKFLIGQFDASEDIPIQRDHSDESYATLGYVRNLYREGDMVYADMLLIDETAISRWKKGLMKKWSIGVSRDFKLSEISAVAFPYIKEARVHSEGKDEAVSLSLVKQDGQFTLIVQDGFDLGESETFSPINESLQRGSLVFEIKNETIVANLGKEGEFKMELKELQDKLTLVEGQFAEVTKTVAAKEQEIVNMTAEVAKYKKAEEDAKFAALKASIQSEVKELVKEGKITPAREAALVETLSKLSEDARKDMIAVFKESGKIGEIDETGRQKSEKSSEFKEGEGKFEFDGKVYDIESMDSESVNDLATAYAKKNDLGWSEAMDVIYEKSKPKEA